MMIPVFMTSGACVAAALVATFAFTLAPTFARANDVGYARFCTIMTSGGANSFRSETEREGAAKRTLFATTDPAIAATVRTRLHLSTLPTVVVRDVDDDARTHGAAKREVVLLSDLNPVKPHWWRASLAADGSVGEVDAADAKTLKSVQFARGMAAYVLFNDLMGGDEPYPRKGCEALFAAWFATFPGGLAVIQAAIANDPPQEPALAASIRESWNRLGKAPAGRPEVDALTRETFEKIGRDPHVRLVYRDPGLPGDGIGEIDLVRIGGKIHTYAAVRARHTSLSTESPMCVVGDGRCGQYYVWP